MSIPTIQLFSVNIRGKIVINKKMLLKNVFITIQITFLSLCL
jgi:hypothetical protein